MGGIGMFLDIGHALFAPQTSEQPQLILISFLNARPFVRDRGQ
jgi:hypothetical protein